MTRFLPLASLAAVLGLALAGCGSSDATTADESACAATADLTVTAVRNPRTGGTTVGQALGSVGDPSLAQSTAGQALAALSGTSADNARLVRAIDRAREDAQMVVGAQYNQVLDFVPALDASLSAVNDVCADLTD